MYFQVAEYRATAAELVGGVRRLTVDDARYFMGAEKLELSDFAVLSSDPQFQTRVRWEDSPLETGENGWRLEYVRGALECVRSETRALESRPWRRALESAFLKRF